MEVMMKRLLDLTTLESLRGAATALLAELYAASLPVWLDEAARAQDATASTT